MRELISGWYDNMSYYFTDNEINALISEEKTHGGTIHNIMNYKESDGHKRTSFDIIRPDESRFIIKLRQNINDMNDFSAIIAFQEKATTGISNYEDIMVKAMSIPTNLRVKSFTISIFILLHSDIRMKGGKKRAMLK